MTSDRRHTAANPRLEALEARFALRAAAALSAQADALPQDISERLRIAREQAVQRARAARTATVAQAAGSRLGNTLSWPGSSRNGGRWWVTVGSVLPLIALVGGLLLIQDWNSTNQIAAAAEVDASLLSDDLPPSAYSDPGFLEFLQSGQD